MPVANDPRNVGGNAHNVQSPSAPPPGGSTTGAVATGIARNPPFRNSIALANRGIDYSTNTRVYRGYLQEYERSLDGGKSIIPLAAQYRLYFYYNPNNISVNWELDDTQVVNPEYQSGGGVDRFIGTQVSWDMFFDRVAEVDFIPEGVLQDVRIFDKLVTGGATGANGYGVTATAPPIVRVQFSRNGGGHQAPLGYIGALIASSINYTQFDIDMVPTRCVISCTMRAFVFQPEITQLDDPLQGAGGTAGYTTPGFKLGSHLNPVDVFGTTVYQQKAGNRAPLNFGALIGTNSAVPPVAGVSGTSAPPTRPSGTAGSGAPPGSVSSPGHRSF